MPAVNAIILNINMQNVHSVSFAWAVMDNETDERRLRGGLAAPGKLAAMARSPGGEKPGAAKAVGAAVERLSSFEKSSCHYKF